MKPRSKHYFTRLHSYADALATVEALKARGFRVKAYGRMHDKRKIFGANGQEYLIMNNNFKNDVRLNSPIAQYAYAWAIYVYPRKPRVKKGKIQLDTTQTDFFNQLANTPRNPGEHPAQVIPIQAPVEEVTA